MITVVVIDDHPIVRVGLRAVLDAAGDMTVLAEGTTGADALHRSNAAGRRTHSPSAGVDATTRGTIMDRRRGDRRPAEGQPTSVAVSTGFSGKTTRPLANWAAAAQAGAETFVAKDDLDLQVVRTWTEGEE